jgi:histone H3/H4
MVRGECSSKNSICFLVLQESYKSVAKKLQECRKSVTRVSQECYKSVTRVLQECYKSVTRVLQECYKSVTRVLQGCSAVECSSKNFICFLLRNVMLRYIMLCCVMLYNQLLPSVIMCYKGVTRVLQEC